MEPLISFVSLPAISFGSLRISSLIQSSIRPRLSLQTKKINSVNFFLLGDTWNVEKTNAIMRMMPDSGKPVYPYLASPPLLKIWKKEQVMTIQEEVCEALSKKCAELFNKNPEDLGPETNLVKDLGAKSTNYVQISAMLEDMYDLEVPYMELKRKNTFAEIGEYINSLFD